MINGKKLVALCTSRIYDPQIHGYIERLNKRLRADNYSLLVFAINSDIYWEEDRPAAEKYVFDLLPYDYLDAVIIMNEKIKSHKIAQKVINASLSHDIPVIIADGNYENVSCINFDYEKGFEQIARHVIETHGVRKPHMMAGQPDNEFSNRRIEVFKKVLSDNGITFDNSMLSYGYFWADPCTEATDELLKRDELPEAIICANDVMAITVSEMLIDAGYRIPEDIIVSGFDGYDEIYFTDPKIASVSCDIILLADSTADAVLESINDRGIHHKDIVPVLIPNESCGCPECNQHPQILKNWFRESFARHNDDNRVLKRLGAFMQTSSTIGEMVSHLDCYKTDNILTAVDRRIFDEESNYFTNEDTDDNPSVFAVIFDSDHPENFKNDTFKLGYSRGKACGNILAPQLRDRILELMESGYPLIFNALDYMGKAFGFVCYYFRDYNISNYTNTMNATNTIGNGIGGYINLRYQRSILEKMDEMYLRDSLTGIYNRIGFRKTFDELIENGTYKDEPVIVIMSDMDGLKYINDNFGHIEGDSAIVTVANALSNSLPEGSIPSRIGGDELFAVVFGKTDPNNIIEKINAFLELYNAASGKPYKVSTSCGYIQTTLSEDFDISQALKQADEIMYKEKKRKKSF
ncbi:MAG: GGDEF domain-containing protein [Eubacterium sp.]|nr:GGDEF domain-containing protein [Eubacterium sp.]